MMVENRVGEPLEPTPDFDCHLSKNVNIDMASVSLQEAYESTQVTAFFIHFYSWSYLWVQGDIDKISDYKNL